MMKTACTAAEDALQKLQETGTAKTACGTCCAVLCCLGSRALLTPAVQVKELLDATADESKVRHRHSSCGCSDAFSLWYLQGADSVDINFDDAQREALSEECARVLAWVESHPKATLADITAREEAMDAIVNPIIIAGDRAARK